MQRGFTIVELLLTLSIFGILFLIVGTISLNSLPKSQLYVEADVVEQTLRRAQARSISQHADSAWGVHLTATDMTLFAGLNYATRIPGYDDVHTFQNGIEPSGITDVQFVFRTGETINVGNITLTVSSTGESQTLSVNALGRVNQQ